jgi:hypothetical protein
VCWDQWYPEAARLTALRGAQILFYPTAIGWHPGEKGEHGKRQHDSWETIQRSHAIANGCYVAVPNRVGHEAPDGGEGIEFWGQSFVADPSGQILAKGSTSNEEILIVEADLGRSMCSGPTGHFSEIVASTLTKGWRSVSSTNIMDGSVEKPAIVTPASQGYRMPAEWEPHEATWLSWPRADGISFPDSYLRVAPTLARMVDALADSERVNINICDEEHEAEVRGQLKKARARIDHVTFSGADQ